MKKKGALMGLILSTIINLWIGIGSVLYGRPPKLKPMSIEGCNNFSRTDANLSVSFSNSTQTSHTFRLFKFT